MLRKNLLFEFFGVFFVRLSTSGTTLIQQPGILETHNIHKKVGKKLLKGEIEQFSIFLVCTNYTIKLLKLGPLYRLKGSTV